MSPSDTLREWAIRLRSILEFNDGVRISLELNDGTVIEYEAEDGLTWVTPDGRRLDVPEDALDAEKWMVSR